jgi:phage terminase large subunit-like protein
MERAGELRPWSFACPDWESRIRSGASLIPHLPLNEIERRRAIGIFNKLRISDIPGQPTQKEAGGEWFREIVGTVLGSVDIETGIRMVREALLLVPKKNTKTTGGAHLMMTALLMNERPEAEFVLTAPTQEISTRAFDRAAGAIELDGFLRARMHVQEHLKTITDRKTKAELKIKTFDGKVLTGGNTAGVLLDELWEIAKNSRASRIIGQIRGGMVSIPEAFLIFITTQSDEIPAGAFKAELRKARAIRDGTEPGEMLPVLYEFPLAIAREREKWSDPANWRMVTPNNGRSLTVERLIPDFETAKRTGEEELRRWASQHLNIEIGLGLHSDRWAGADHWEAAAEEGLTLDALIERCEVIVVGIDGGGLDDLLGLAVLGRETATRRWLLWTHAWAHQAVFERRKDIAERLCDFARDGDLTVVELLGQDVTDVADIVERIAELGLLPEKAAVGLDPVGIGQIVDELKVRGLTEDQIVGISQGWKMSGAIKTAERGLADGTLVHAGQKMMDWVIGNAKVEPRGNAITITKQAAGSAKIDPLAASFNAVALMAMNPEASGSAYNDHDLVVL